MVGDIYVGTGTDEKLWRVHIKRFGDVSPWLKRAFARAIAEQPGARHPVVRMPEDSPRHFDWVHNYIYAVSFSGLRGAPVPAINGAGSHGLQPQQPPQQAPAEPDSDDDVVITEVRVKVENEANPLVGAPPEPAPVPDSKPPAADNDDLQEVAADLVTPRDIMDLYILALKLEIYSLRNAAIDALHVWFHPDMQEKEKPGGARRKRARTANPNNGANPNVAVAVDDDDDGVGGEDYEPSKQLPFRRVPWMTDVRHAFARTPEDNPLRRFLISTAAIFLFSKRPEGKELPEEWKDVLTGTGEIGYCMLRFIASCRWVVGCKTQQGEREVLRVWPKHAFHEAAANISVE